MFADLHAARAVSDLLTATECDPIALGDQLSAARRRQQAADVERWRAWLDANLDRVLELSAGEFDAAGVWPWLFPMGGRSQRSPQAPVVGRRTMSQALQDHPDLALALQRAFNRAVEVLGLVERHGALQWRDQAWPWALGSKQDVRVYRMLRSVNNAGMSRQAAMLMAFIERELGADATRAGVLRWYRHQVAS